MKENKKLKIGAHAILGLVILGLIVFMVLKLLHWQSRTVSIDTNVEEGSFDMETLDYYIYPTEDQLAAREDDGVNDILIIGNCAANSNGDKHSVVNELNKSLKNAKIYTLIADRSKITCDNEIELSSSADPYSFYYIAKSLVNDDFKSQYETDYSLVFTTDNQKGDYFNTLNSLDMTRIDTILIFYSLSDYYASSITMLNDDTNVRGYHGSLKSGIKLLQEKYPWASIILASPYPEYMEGENGEIMLDSSTDLGFGNGSLYIQNQYAIATELCISFIDNYYYTINEKNITDYVDSFFLKDKGVDLVADHIASFINNKGNGAN